VGRAPRPTPGTRGEEPSLSGPSPESDLFSAPLTHEMILGPAVDVDAAALALPAAPAVAVLESAAGEPVLIATTADLRGFVRSRLGSAGDERPGRVRYRELCARVSATRVGSSLEADAVYLGHARRLMPRSYAVVCERWRAWYAHVDPETDHPRWTKTNLKGLVESRSASREAGAPAGGVLLGPIADKDAAGRFIEAAVDAFDLCRYHELLVQAPRAAPCAYKEMGRCPAPCDGSEPMERYRDRTRDAVKVLSGTLADEIAGEESRMRSAAERGAFEEAGASKARVERLERLRGRGLAGVRRLDEYAPVFVLPVGGGGRARWARVVALSGGRLVALASVRAGDLDGARAVSERLGVLARGVTLAESPAALDALAVVARWLFTPASRPRGVMLHALGPAADVSPGAVDAAVRSVTKRDEAPAVEDLELENVGAGEG
jgi:hypothetical protein